MRDTENPFDVPVSSSGCPCSQLRPARSRGLIMLASLLKLIHVGFLSLVTIGIFYIQFFFFLIFMFLYIWPCQVLVAARGIFDLHCGT